MKTNSRLLGALIATCLLAFLAAQAEQPLVFRDVHWAKGEPLLAVSPDGSGLLLVNRTGGTMVDHRMALLRAAELRNPGLLASFGQLVFGKWIQQGVASRNAGGRLLIEDQQHLDELNARLRVEVALLLRPYLDEIGGALPDEPREDLAWNPIAGTAVRKSTALLAPVSANWYEPLSQSSGELDHVTTCVACPSPDGSAYCPGQCASGCDPDGTNCTSVEVGTLLPRAGPIPARPSQFGPRR